MEQHANIPPSRWIALGTRRAFAVGAGLAVFAFAVDMPGHEWDSATVATTLFLAAIALGGALSGALAAALQRVIDSPKVTALVAIAATGWTALAITPFVRVGDAPWMANLAWWLVMIGLPALIGMIVVLATPTPSMPAPTPTHVAIARTSG